MVVGNTAMDLAAMESEAKAKARKQVANLLQRPDQLEKTEHIRKRVARKKGSVEAMLKTAVQSQLDGVRTGLNQLKSALEDIKEIKAGLQEVDTTYRSIENLGDTLKLVREENSRHSQLAAAVDNLKHIFNVPEVVKKTEEHINEGRLLNAHKSLTELEMARDNLLMELYKQPKHSPTDKHTVMHYFGDVEGLSENLFKHMSVILQRAMGTIRREPSTIVTVLRIIEREENVDRYYTGKKHQSSDNLPPGRPKKWKEKAMKVLEEAVQSRIVANQMEDRDMDKMWLVRHLERTRQLVLEDLRVVKSLCGPCFPPSWEIITNYVNMYHNNIASHLDDIVQQGLENNEIVHLLTWVGTYKTKELMGHPELRIDTDKLGPLLENRVIREMQNQYLHTLRSNFKEWMANSLKTDLQDWYRDQEPDADDKGYFNTSLPSILFQMIEQNLTVAASINDSLVDNAVQICLEELINFSKPYAEELAGYKEKHVTNRLQSDRMYPQFYLSYMIANVNNCQTFADLISMLKTKYKQNADSAEDRRFKQCAKMFEEISTKACGYLLDEVFLDLQVYVNELLTRQWLQNRNAVETICMTLEDYCRDFVHLRNHFYDMLLTQAQERIHFDYLKALFAKKISFRTYEERLPAADKIVEEGEYLQRMFNKLSTFPQDSSPFDVFPRLAEIVRLKDTSMMSLEILGLVQNHPDIRPEHLINLLLMRGDVSRSEARELVADAIGEDNMSKQRPSGLFSRIPAP